MRHAHAPLITNPPPCAPCIYTQGGWEDDETVEAAAKRETVEEAGVRGCLEEPIVGAFAFSSGKPDTTSRHNGKCIASIFVMHVEEELEVWPEGHERKRFWVSNGTE
jgi:diphosphoinositol-polyphosphate diphosphatase